MNTHRQGWIPDALQHITLNSGDVHMSHHMNNIDGNQPLTHLVCGKPYPLLLPHAQDGSFFNLGPTSVDLVITLSQPTEREIANTRTGIARFGIYLHGPVLFFMHRFGDEPWSDSPFSIQMLPPERRHLPVLSDGQHLVMHVTLVESTTNIIRALRLITIPPQMAKTLLRLAAQQLESPLSRERYNEVIDKAYKRHTDTMSMVRHAVLTMKGGHDAEDLSESGPATNLAPEGIPRTDSPAPEPCPQNALEDAQDVVSVAKHGSVGDIRAAIQLRNAAVAKYGTHAGIDISNLIIDIETVRYNSHHDIEIDDPSFTIPRDLNCRQIADHIRMQARYVKRFVAMFTTNEPKFIGKGAMQMASLMCDHSFVLPDLAETAYWLLTAKLQRDGLNPHCSWKFNANPAGPSLESTLTAAELFKKLDITVTNALVGDREVPVDIRQCPNELYTVQNSGGSFASQGAPSSMSVYNLAAARMVQTYFHLSNPGAGWIAHQLSPEDTAAVKVLIANATV